MFRNLRLKAICVAAVTAAAMLCSIPSFAANTVQITSATTSEDAVLTDTPADAPAVGKAELITIDVKISSPSAEVSVLVVEASAGSDISSLEEADIEYLNQEASDPSDGTCSITFRLPLDVQPGTYAVYVSGTNVEAKAVKYLKVAEPSGETYLSGDVTGNGAVTSDDALWILRYGINLPGPAGLDIDAGDVTGNGEVNSDDALWILRDGINLPCPAGVEVGVEKTR